ncbi:fimbrial protein [Enterobacteriaceae bacterium RIT692]|nr:fimbrial protein [Enterobacteriaceae bacterium RIT692]
MKLFKQSLSSLLIIGAMMTFAQAENGTVVVGASITDNSCTVPANQINQQINIGAITPETLTAASNGEIVRTKPIVFDFTNCPNTFTNVGIEFDYPEDTAQAQYMENTGSAEGVLLGITDSSGTAVPKNGRVMSDNFDANAGTGTVTAQVSAYRVGTEAPGAGSIESVATITVVNQ